MAGLKQKAYAAAGVDAAEQKIMDDLDQHGEVEWRDTLLDTKPPYGPYAARALYGIWAAAPILHNGSVPTLYDLLLPPAQRPKTFPLAGREYDPVKLGFVVDTACDRKDCVVDTTRNGDGNGGHLWGTDLSEPDRMALSIPRILLRPSSGASYGFARSAGYLLKQALTAALAAEAKAADFVLQTGTTHNEFSRQFTKRREFETLRAHQ